MLTPFQELRCPICGTPNECSAALTGSFSELYWFSSIQFSSHVLALVPDSKRDKACICRACATKEEQ